jgi:hypothetical protein
MFQPIRVAVCGRKNAPPLFSTGSFRSRRHPGSDRSGRTENTVGELRIFAGWVFMDDMKLLVCISSYLLLFISLLFSFAQAGKYLIYVGTNTVRGGKGLRIATMPRPGSEDLGLAAKRRVQHFSLYRRMANFCMQVTP